MLMFLVRHDLEHRYVSYLFISPVIKVYSKYFFFIDKRCTMYNDIFRRIYYHQYKVSLKVMLGKLALTLYFR